MCRVPLLITTYTTNKRARNPLYEPVDCAVAPKLAANIVWYGNIHDRCIACVEAIKNMPHVWDSRVNAIRCIGQFARAGDAWWLCSLDRWHWTCERDTMLDRRTSTIVYAKYSFYSGFGSRKLAYVGTRDVNIAFMNNTILRICGPPVVLRFQIWITKLNVITCPNPWLSLLYVLF